MTMVAPTDGKRAYYWQSQRNRSTLPPPNQPSCARSCKCLWRTEDKSEWPSWHAHDAMNRGVICGRYSNSLSESSCEQEHHSAWRMDRNPLTRPPSRLSLLAHLPSPPPPSPSSSSSSGTVTWPIRPIHHPLHRQGLLCTVELTLFLFVRGPSYSTQAKDTSCPKREGQHCAK